LDGWTMPSEKVPGRTPERTILRGCGYGTL
jgi:hypothetical protein